MRERSVAPRATAPGSSPRRARRRTRRPDLISITQPACTSPIVGPVAPDPDPAEAASGASATETQAASRPGHRRPRAVDRVDDEDPLGLARRRDEAAVLGVEGDLGRPLGEEALQERLGSLVDREGDVAALARAGVGAAGVIAERGQDLVAQRARQLQGQLARRTSAPSCGGRAAGRSAAARRASHRRSGVAVADDLERHRVARARTARSARGRSVSPTILWPSTATITSPPAVDLWSWKLDRLVRAPGARRRRPGPPWITLATSAPVSDRDPEPVGELRVERLCGDADVGVLAVPLARSWSSERFTRSDRDREPDPLVASARGPELVNLLVDPDHAAVGVEQRPARVPGVDRGVGLDRALDVELGQRLDRAVGGRDDADGQRVVLAERAADRRDRLADL